MHVLQEGSQIEEAIRTMLLQLCRVGVVYENSLSIAGTLGVTIDKKSVVLVHFDEHYTSGGARKGDGSSQGTDCGESELRLLGAEALYSLQDYLSPPLASDDTATCSSLQQMEKEAVDSKMFQFPDIIPIDDSDSESFAGLPFDVDPEPATNIDVKAVDLKHVIITGVRDTTGETEMDGLILSSPNDNVDVTVRASERQRACDVCGRDFTGVAALESHLVATHGVTHTPSGGKIPHFACADCGRKFRFRCLLEKHARMHDAVRPHRCPDCGNVYRHSESLALHACVHTGGRLACHLCNKAYATRKLFQKHIVYMHEIRHSSSTS